MEFCSAFSINICIVKNIKTKVELVSFCINLKIILLNILIQYYYDIMEEPRMVYI